jgi:hypothetical protein
VRERELGRKREREGPGERIMFLPGVAVSVLEDYSVCLSQVFLLERRTMQCSALSGIQ